MPERYFADTRPLLQAFHLIAPLSAALRERIAGSLDRETRSRGYRLLVPGTTADRLYFIVSGFARTFVADPAGREHTTCFLGVNDFIIPPLSFFSQRPAVEYIELLEPSVLLSLRWDHLMSLYADFPEFNHHMRRLTEKYYQEAEQRALLFRLLKPAERYQHLLRDQPSLLQKASLGQLASFLGITQETLSRIRRQQGRSRSGR
jgi:CRP-like cAMP-binding protein